MYKEDGTSELKPDTTPITAQTYKIQVVVAANDAWFSQYDDATKFGLVINPI